jgi:hypothetical protein
MKSLIAALLPLFLLVACAPARHREALYGPSPIGVAANDPKEIADQIASVNSQLSGTEAQITTLDSKIAAAERPKGADQQAVQLSGYLNQRGALEARHSALLTRRTRLQSLSNSLNGRATVPLQ